MTAQEFIKRIAGDSVVMGMRYDVPPSILIAQAMLESNNGNSLLSSKYNNLAGMKVGSGKGIWTGNKVTMDTKENIQGMTVIMPQDFRTYESWRQSIEDIAHRYANRFKLTLTKVGGDANRFLAEPGMSEAMKTGYATDPTYEKKIRSLIDKYNLMQFDKVIAIEGEKKKVGYYETKIAS